MPLDIKYRPQTIEEVVGNKAIKASIMSLTEKPKAVMFTGPKGTGKTTFAYLLAKKFGCDLNANDFQEYDVGRERSLGSVRMIGENVSYRPMRGVIRCVVLDECHFYESDTQNSLLKMLEDCPSHVMFVLCTTDPQKVIGTVKDRCLIYETELISLRESVHHVKLITEKEGKSLPEDIYFEIAQASEGSLRKALVILEQVINMTNKEMMLSIIKTGSVEDVTILSLCKLLVKKVKYPNGEVTFERDFIPILKDINNKPDVKAESVRYAILAYLNKVFLNEPNNALAKMMLNFSESFYNSGKSGLILACYLSCNKQ